MVRKHHRLNGREFEFETTDSEGQGSLACCSPQGHKESEMTERLNKNNILMQSVTFNWYVHIFFQN